MDTTEKQESQKTIVAFVAGLLIGGLLVWVFSSSPAAAPVDNDNENATTTEEGTNSETEGEVESETTTSETTPRPQTSTAQGVSIADQPAGNKVTIGEVAFPTKAGWVAIRDYANGTVGGVLGAARYDTDGGLTPSTVSLLRNTEKGKTYVVVFLEENGDRKFDTKTDKLVEGVSDTFVAQ